MHAALLNEKKICMNLLPSEPVASRTSVLWLKSLASDSKAASRLPKTPGTAVPGIFLCVPEPAPSEPVASRTGVLCGKGFRIFLIRDHPRKSAVSRCLSITRSPDHVRSPDLPLCSFVSFVVKVLASPLLNDQLLTGYAIPAPRNCR